MGQKAAQKQLRRNIMCEDKGKWRRIFNRIYLFLLAMLSFGMVVLFQTSLFRGGEDLTYAIWHVRKFPEDED